MLGFLPPSRVKPTTATPLSIDPQTLMLASASATVSPIRMSLVHPRLNRASSPSVVLLRGVSELTSDDHAALISGNFPAISTALDTGAIVTITPARVCESEIFLSTDETSMPHNEINAGRPHRDAP